MPEPMPEPMPEQQAAQDRFDAIATALAGQPGVTLGSPGRGFGSGALRAGGRIFAMPRDGGLVLKLPARRVAELIASGQGMPFDAGKGTPMKEWVVVGEQAAGQWLDLAAEALAFARGGVRSSTQSLDRER
jgi:hypothetical protein